jgi:hypothetical protein
MVRAEQGGFTSSTICLTTPRSMRIVLPSQSTSFHFSPKTSEIPKSEADSEWQNRAQASDVVERFQ